MRDLRHAARLLGGEVVSHNSVLHPGPGHSRKDRSQKTTFLSSTSFITHSFCGDSFQDCRDLVHDRLGIEREFAPKGVQVEHRSKGVQVGQPDEEVIRRKRAALDVWEGAGPLINTPAQKHLRARGLHSFEDVKALRFHPACPWRDNSGEVLRVPALVGAMRNIHTDELTAVHRTRLSAEGEKLGRKMLGVASGAAIKLDPDDAVSMGLILGEGVESCLAARQLGFRPVWALGSVNGIARFPVLSGIEALSILAEDDKTGANARAIEECAARWDGPGRAVLTIASKVGGDINDAIRGRA